MQFNSDKFEVIRFWPDTVMSAVFKNQHHYLDPTGRPIEEKSHIKDLGVMISSDLTFTRHIKTVITSCSKLVGWTLRSFKSRSRFLMVTIWKTMIQSRLDYCSQLWSPNSPGLINQLEEVQWNFTRRITGMKDLDYWDRLQSLQMLSQERRRERYIAIFIWKVAMGLVDGYTLSFTNGQQGRLCEVGHINQSAPACVKNAREASLPVKGAKLFNLLPREIRDITATKVNTFKSKLDIFLRSIPDQPTIPGRQRPAQSNSLLHQVPMTRLQQQ